MGFTQLPDAGHWSPCAHAAPKPTCTLTQSPRNSTCDGGHTTQSPCTSHMSHTALLQHRRELTALAFMRRRSAAMGGGGSSSSSSASGAPPGHTPLLHWSS